MRETAKLSTAVHQLAGESCSICLDIHLGDYNVFLLEDYTGVGDVGGKVAAGGNLTMSGFSLGTDLPAGNLSNMLVAGGTLDLKNGGLPLQGSAWYGGSFIHEGLNCEPDCGLVAKGTPIDFAARFAELRSLSARLASLKGSTFSGVTLSGSSPCLNVFEVDASDFSKWWHLDVPVGSFVVINIRGTSVTFPGDMGGINPLNSRRVLYNFVEATTLTAKNFGLSGTVLAPYAHVTFELGGWSGGLYAVSLNKTGTQLNNNPLDELAEAACGNGTYCEGTCVAKKELGTACSSDNQCVSERCVDGVCCNTACDGECDACDLAGHEGTCSLVSSEVKCRDSGGDCDVAEYCTGAEAACPADAVDNAGTSCRAASGRCEVAEVCDGSSKACPLDEHVPNGTACGTSTGDWGSCEGFSDYCDPTGTESRTVTASTCEAGMCTLSSTGKDTRSCTRLPPGPQPCPEDSESWGTCGGFSDTCDETGTQSHSKTTYQYKCATGKCEPKTVNDTVTCTRSTAGVQCRAAADVCDVAESCSGGVCPANGKAQAGTSCNDNNTCTTNDMCNGAGTCQGGPPPPCPADSETVGACGGFSSSNTCDETGTRLRTKTKYQYNCATAKCEASTVATPEPCGRSTEGKQCRAAADACDSAEYCSGGTCPEPTSPDPVCCSMRSVEQKWINWYWQILSRCPDRGGLDFWVGVDDAGEMCAPINGKYTYYYSGGACPKNTAAECWRGALTVTAREVGELPPGGACP